MDAAVPAMIDLAFAVDGDDLAHDHRRALADSVEAALPWLAGLPDVGIHRLNVSAGGGPMALLSGRTRLTLRLPRERSAAAQRLSGSTLRVGEARLGIGAAQARELLPWGTLYAHLVAAGELDEVEFLHSVQSGLDELGVVGRAICGRAQSLESGMLRGFSLMLDGLSAAAALRLLQSGLGAHRRLGCGLFVAHRSAAAVGAPP